MAITKCKGAVSASLFQPRKLKSRSGGDKQWCLSSIWIAVVLLGCNIGVAQENQAASAKPAARMLPRTLVAWTHEDSGSQEFNILKKAAERFNRQQHAYKVEIISSHRRDYGVAQI